jgi:3-oxoacyl-[acyl-carrier protein] reductase
VSLARAGAYVVVNYRENQAAAEAALERVVAAGGRGDVSRFDVADESQVDQAVKKIVDQHGKVDILINNAGIAIDNLLLRVKRDEWDRVLDVNLKGAAYCAKAVSRSMIRERYGRVVNMTSVVGQMGNAGQTVYAASKAAMIGLTKAMARELAARNVTVNAVAPGFIETEMTAGLSGEAHDEYLRAIPLRRLGTCEEVADLVCFLASPRAGYITGQVVGVNGGLYM